MTKEEQYQEIIPQIQSLIAGETDLIANMANIVAVLHNTFHFLWTGFYIVRSKELVLGPFQGPIACTRIPYKRGVCGTAWAQNKTLIVPNVHEFPGHIACSSASNSELRSTYAVTTKSSPCSISTAPNTTLSTLSIKNIWK